MKPKVAHIIVTDKCGHNCPMCCNKNYDIHAIPNITMEELESVETICLTGGEPFMSKDLDMFVEKLRPFAKKIYVYASGKELDLYWHKYNHLPRIDGLSLSPKDAEDVMSILSLLKSDFAYELLRKNINSNRLYLMLSECNPTNYKLDIGRVALFSLQTVAFLFDLLHFDVFFRTWKDEIVSPEGEIFRNISFKELGI